MNSSFSMSISYSIFRPAMAIFMYVYRSFVMSFARDLCNTVSNRLKHPNDDVFSISIDYINIIIQPLQIAIYSKSEPIFKPFISPYIFFFHSLSSVHIHYAPFMNELFYPFSVSTFYMTLHHYVDF